MRQAPEAGMLLFPHTTISVIQQCVFPHNINSTTPIARAHASVAHIISSQLWMVSFDRLPPHPSHTSRSPPSHDEIARQEQERLCHKGSCTNLTLCRHPSATLPKPCQLVWRRHSGEISMRVRKGKYAGGRKIGYGTEEDGA